jgi:hypothetical protein
MAISSSPRGLTYTPSHPALTWNELHDELTLLADRELSLEAVDSILRLCAEDGELLSVTVRCHLAAGCCYVQTADRTLGRAYEHKLEADGTSWYLGRADLLGAA